MAQAPAVVIIARHGARLDAADQSWHLSTPTPYDPPLTYGGWNQCRALGVRIASLLNAREQSFHDATTEPPAPNGTTSHDFARLDGAFATKDGASGDGSSRKRKRRKHKVVIHSSPFLRCLQTSVAIAAGMAQYQPTIETGSRSSSGSSTSKSRTPHHMHSASPKLRGMEGVSSPYLAPISEPRHAPHDLAHEIARRALNEQKRYKRFKMRVDAFLGEWLNPQYFDQITPPPPSAMMLATAKGELIQNESIHVYTPTVSSTSSSSSLWGGGANGRSRESTLDDWSHVQDALPAPTPRSRGNSVSSVESHDAGSGRHSPLNRSRSPFRPGHVLQPFTSTLPKQETSIYVPPTPSYAVSSSDEIPRGYVAHARNATVGVDYQWDSSRPPQDWGDGGEYGEEWSAMHKRFRRGLNHLVHWYSQHGADDRGEDALGFDQAVHHNHEEDESEEQEDLVVVLVTHGAGSNALIGALTGQPVLLDVGMASLTMAVRKEDAPPLRTPPSTEPQSAGTTPTSSRRNSPQPPFANESNGHGYDHRRRSSLDLGLSAIYEMKLVSSSEHIRPGADPTKLPTAAAQASLAKSDAIYRLRQRHGDSAHAAAGAPIRSSWNLGEPQSQQGRSNTNASLGSIRRPSAASSTAPAAIPAHVGGSGIRNNSMPPDALPLPTPPFSPGLTPGLWTPPASRTPIAVSPMLPAQVKEERAGIFSSLDQIGGRHSPGHDLVLDFSNSPPESRPGTSSGPAPVASQLLDVAINGCQGGTADEGPSASERLNGNQGFGGNDLSLTKSQQEEAKEDVAALPKPGDMLPQALSRVLSQKGLWGNQPKGDNVQRTIGEPKRRWTVNQQD